MTQENKKVKKITRKSLAEEYERGKKDEQTEFHNSVKILSEVILNNHISKEIINTATALMTQVQEENKTMYIEGCLETIKSLQKENSKIRQSERQRIREEVEKEIKNCQRIYQKYYGTSELETVNEYIGRLCCLNWMKKILSEKPEEAKL